MLQTSSFAEVVQKINTRGPQLFIQPCQSIFVTHVDDPDLGWERGGWQIGRRTRFTIYFNIVQMVPRAFDYAAYCHSLFEKGLASYKTKLLFHYDDGCCWLRMLQQHDVSILKLHNSN